MKQKLFSEKNYSKKCVNCAHGTLTDDKMNVLCEKKGVKEPDDYCRKYTYDPLKRIPDKIVIRSDYTAEDFKL